MDLVLALAPLVLPFAIFLIITILLLALAVGVGAIGFFGVIFAAIAGAFRKLRAVWT